MNSLKHSAMLSILLLLTGCASFEAKTELLKGRMALLDGMPDAAIVHFQQATALDGEVKYSSLQEGAWTYLGRAHYDAKQYPQARQALERALAINSDDGLARLYLGLTLAREGNHASGRKEVLGGLQSLNETLNYIVYNTQSGPYWDPGGKIRNELRAAQAEAAAANPILDKLFSRLESIGVSVEQEIDLARRDESFDLRHNSGSDM